MRTLFGAVLALGLLAAGLVSARPLTIDDELSLQELMSTTIDPSGRWLVIEATPPYDRSVRFEGWVSSRVQRSRIYTVDLTQPKAARLAFPQNGRGGYIPGPFSPSGRSMLVFRQLGASPEMGVVTLGSRRVRWLGLQVDIDDEAETAVWRGETQVVALVQTPGAATRLDRFQQGAIRQLPKLWENALTGRAPSTILQGSGRYIDLHLTEPPRSAVVIDLRRGRTRRVARGDIGGFSLSPDGRWLALLNNGPRVPLSAAPVAPQSRWRLRGMSLVDLGQSSPVTAPCPECDVLPQSLRWSGRGDLLFSARAPSGPLRTRLWRLDAGAPKARLVETQGLVNVNDTAPWSADWMGADPIVFASSDGRPAGRADWVRLTENGPVVLTAKVPAPSALLAQLSPKGLVLMSGGVLWRADPQGGDRSEPAPVGSKVLAPEHPHLMSRASPYDPKSQTAVIASASDGVVSASPVADGPTWSLNRKSTWADNGDVANGLNEPVVRCASRHAVVLVTRDPHGVQSIAVLGSNGPARPVMTLNAQLVAVDWSTPRAIPDPLADGTMTYDWLYPPTRSLGAGPPPLVVIGYPGLRYVTAPTLGQPGRIAFDDNPQILAAQGYAVLMPSLPVAPDSIAFGADYVQQILASIDRAAAVGGFDPKRVAFWGHSAGGYSALRLATETNRFSAIIAAAGMYDFISVRGQIRPSAWFNPDWPSDTLFPQAATEAGQFHLMATPLTGLDRYIQFSPILHLDKVTTPLLIVAGDQDVGSFSQSGELFASLYRLNKDALFLAAYGETHTLSSPPNVRSYWTTAFGFLRSHLQGEEPRSPSAP